MRTLLYIVILTSIAYAVEFDFSKPDIVINGARINNVSVADVNGDNKQDIIYVDSAGIKVHLQKGQDKPVGLIAHFTKDITAPGIFKDDISSYYGLITTSDYITLDVLGAGGNVLYKSLDFNGLGGLELTGLTLPEDWTVSCKALTTAFTGRHAILSVGAPITIAQYDNVNMGFSILRQSGQIFLKKPYTLNTWNTYTITKKGQEYCFFVDGVLVGCHMQLATDLNAVMPLELDKVGVQIGKSRFSFASLNLKGKVGDVKVFNRALNKAEILVMFSK